MTGPVETKTAAHASAAAVTGVITWALVSYVPAFASGLPGPLATFLPFIVASFLGAASGWLAPHSGCPAVPAPQPAHARQP